MNQSSRKSRAVRARARLRFGACAAGVALVASLSTFGGNGEAAAATIHVPGEFATIQAAITAATNGDEILVAPGTYTGVGNWNLNFGGKAVALRCAGGGDGDCIIDVQGGPGNERRAFVFTSGESAATIIDGFTIRNGYRNRGGAAFLQNGSSPTFKNCVFENNTAWGIGEGDGGGAVYATGSAPTFLDCKFIGNHVEANFEFSGGGAIYNVTSATTITGCLFENNSAYGPVINTGGGGVLNVADSAPVITKSTFVNNQIIGSGGGILNVDLVQTTAIIDDCTFTGNVAAFGGGLRELNSRSKVSNCLFQNNLAVGSAFFNGNGGGYVGNAGSDSTFTDCDFVDNWAANCCGGVGVYGSGKAAFTNCTFLGNTCMGSGGGGLMDTQGSAQFINCLIADNHANVAGGGLWVGNSSIASIINSTIVENTAVTNGGGVRVTTGASATVRNSILWANSPTQLGVSASAGPLSVVWSNVQGGWAGMGNINSDPLFQNAADWNYHLSAGSPSIDKGNNASVPVDVTTDLDGNPRIVDGDDDGVAIVDMGAYEFQGDPAPVCVGDLTGSGSVGVPDLLQLLSCWGSVAPGSPCESADLTGSGSVGVPDLLALLSAWGPCP